MNRSPLGAALLEREGRDLPDEDACQTGEEYAETYLCPLSELPLLEGRVRCGARIVSVGKEGIGKADLIGQEARLEKPFRLLLEEGGTERAASGPPKGPFSHASSQNSVLVSHRRRRAPSHNAPAIAGRSGSAAPRAARAAMSGSEGARRLAAAQVISV